MSAVLRNILTRHIAPTEEEQRRLLRELALKNASGLPADFAPQPLARDPSTLLTRSDAPPPIDPLAGMEAARNATYRSNPMLPVITRNAIEPEVVAPDVPLSPAGPVPMTAPPTMIVRNDKGRPTGAVGDVLTRDQDLLEAQLGYKAPVSKKQLALQALFGFLNHGIPGAIGSSLNYGLNQDYRNQQTMGSDIANTEGRIQRGLLQRKTDNALANDETERFYKLNQITRGQTEADRKAAHDEATLKLERDKMTGTITRGEADRQQKILDREERARHNKEIENLTRAGLGAKEENSGYINTAVDQNIQEAATERDRIAASLKDVPPTIETTVTDPYTLEQTKKQVPNPAYTDLMGRYRKLDDDIRDLRLKKKPLTRGGSYTEADVRARATAAGKDPEAAIAKAKAAGLLK